MQADTGELKWTYRCNGRIVNPAIAIGHRQVYFVEVHDDQYNLVALDAGSGAAAWRETHDFSQNGRALHLAYADDTIAVTGAEEKWHIQVFSARDGSLMWHSEYGFPRNGYGSDEYPPLIIGNVLFTEPYAYNLRSGKRVNLKGEEDDKWRQSGGRRGCSAASSSTTCVIWGDPYPAIYDIE